MAVAPKTGRSLLRRIRREERSKIPKLKLISIVDQKDSAYLVSISSDEEGLYSTFNLYLGRLHINLEIPAFIQPYRTAIRVKSAYQRRWKYMVYPRRYSIGYLPKEGALIVTYGRQSGNLANIGRDKFKSYTLPWRDYRIVRYMALDKHTNAFISLDFDYKDNVSSRSFPKPTPRQYQGVELTAIDGFGDQVYGKCYVEVVEYENGTRTFTRGLLEGKCRIKRALVISLYTGEDFVGNPSLDEIDKFEMLERETVQEAIERFIYLKSLNPAKHRQLTISTLAQ